MNKAKPRREKLLPKIIKDGLELRRASIKLILELFRPLFGMSGGEELLPGSSHALGAWHRLFCGTSGS